MLLRKNVEFYGFLEFYYYFCNQVLANRRDATLLRQIELSPSGGASMIFEGNNNSISSYSVCLKCCKLIKRVSPVNDKLMSAFRRGLNSFGETGPGTT